MGWIVNPIAWILFKLYELIVPKKYWREKHLMFLIIASFILTIVIIILAIFGLCLNFIRH